MIEKTSNCACPAEKLFCGVGKMRGFIMDLIFPVECLKCGQGKEWLCEKCLNLLPLNNTFCFCCKKENIFGELCSEKCKAHYCFNGIWGAGDYEEAITGKMIKNLKYRFSKNISVYLGDYLSLFLKNLIAKRIVHHKNIPKTLLHFPETIIMPVPLHKKRLKWRGFNQAEFIAQRISANFGLKINNKNLLRKRFSRPQAKLNEKQRKTNLKNSFLWNGKNLNNKNIILIDDVATTGTTLNECARVLKENGAGEVWGLVAAT